MDFIGPLAISEVLDDTHYKLQLVTTMQDILPGIWHINRLKPGAKITPEGTAKSDTISDTAPITRQPYIHSIMCLVLQGVLRTDEYRNYS